MKVEGIEVNTKIYVNNVKMREEELITLENWVKFNRIEPGQKLKLWWKEKEYWKTEIIWVGNCTPYIQPTENDGVIDWNFNSDICKRYIIEVHRSN